MRHVDTLTTNLCDIKVYCLKRMSMFIVWSVLECEVLQSMFLPDELKTDTKGEKIFVLHLPAPTSSAQGPLLP